MFSKGDKMRQCSKLTAERPKLRVGLRTPRRRCRRFNASDEWGSLGLAAWQGIVFCARWEISHRGVKHPDGPFHKINLMTRWRMELGSR